MYYEQMEPRQRGQAKGRDPSQRGQRNQSKGNKPKEPSQRNSARGAKGKGCKAKITKSEEPSQRCQGKGAKAKGPGQRKGTESMEPSHKNHYRRHLVVLAFTWRAPKFAGPTASRHLRCCNGALCVYAVHTAHARPRNPPTEPTHNGNPPTDFRSASSAHRHACLQRLALDYTLCVLVSLPLCMYMYACICMHVYVACIHSIHAYMHTYTCMHSIE